MRGVLYDVTPQRQAEEERERYLREIEALNERLRRSVQETHHRVKNNLQVISAMANVQTLKGTDNVPAEEFARLIQHVRSLAIVHDILTHESRFGGDHPSVSAQETLESLLPLLQTMTGGRRLRFDIDEVPLSLKQTGSVAMLVNELVSNAVKHGEGDISIHLRAEGERVRLSVCDSGSGFPADFDSRRVGNTGLELIDSITRWDLNGSVEYGSDSNRAEVVIWFPRVAD